MAIRLTKAAARHIEKMLEQRGHGIGFRLETRISGCTGFEFSNPNIVESCGCGESFNVRSVG